ncbi:MAG: adenylosuccinate lyase [Treponema sp.]|nr:MAG: adenylosuccinate lyase [Treponema sp.]
MEMRSIYENISPIDSRYSLKSKGAFELLAPYLSAEAEIRYCTRAEIALVKTHLVLGKRDAKLTDELAGELDEVVKKVLPEEVIEEEKKTQHNIRALVNVMKTKVPEAVAPLVHLGATSADILDTAFSMRVRDAVTKVILPMLRDCEVVLCNLAEKEADTPQVGRTHGQHAVPITFGYAVAEYVSRLGKSILRIEELVKDLRGKFAGATGSYNAVSLIAKKPLEFEKTYLEFLGLLPSEYSHQLVEPEYMLRVLLECNIAFGIIANIADDLRNLQRTEIGEVFEFFSATQVGSSTMPQKRNPWNSEHVKSLWKAFAPRVLTFYMDQISEHQRDLSNSASQRFVADYLTGFGLAIGRMHSILSGLNADKNAMQKNLLSGGGKVQGGVLAEPAYILLAEAGESDGHEIIRQITVEAEEKSISFYDVLKSKENIFNILTKQLQKLNFENPEDFFKNPANYKGLASERAKHLAKKYRDMMK